MGVGRRRRRRGRDGSRSREGEERGGGTGRLVLDSHVLLLEGRRFHNARTKGIRHGRLQRVVSHRLTQNLVWTRVVQRRWPLDHVVGVLR